MPFRIQIVSDLHLGDESSPASPSDSLDFTIPANADYLALLGDSARVSDQRLFRWLEDVLSKFKMVFYVMGNHESYGSTVDSALASLEVFAAQPRTGKLVILNRTRYDISDTLTVLGCTLWSDLRSPSSLSASGEELIMPHIKDFTHIRDFTPTAYQQLHLADVEWLDSSISSLITSSPHKKIVVFTHHAPSVYGTSDPKFLPAADTLSPTDAPVTSLPGYATDLTTHPCWHPAVQLWAFGHTHWCCDFVCGSVRLYANQRGRREVGFDVDAVVEVETRDH